MIRVIHAESHPLFREGVRSVIEQAHDIEIVASACTGTDAVRVVTATRPDVVLIDLTMPDMSGVDATRAICASRANAAVIMLCACSDRATVLAAFDAGASGYLMKDVAPDALIAGIRDAANGDAPVDSRAARALVAERKAHDQAALTPREEQVLALVHQGCANKTIAATLGISEKTVKAHLTRIFQRIGVTGRTQAALWARDNLPAQL